MRRRNRPPKLRDYVTDMSEESSSESDEEFQQVLRTSRQVAPKEASAKEKERIYSQTTINDIVEASSSAAAAEPLAVKLAPSQSASANKPPTPSMEGQGESSHQVAGAGPIDSTQKGVSKKGGPNKSVARKKVPGAASLSIRIPRIIWD